MSINKDSQKAPNLRFKGFTDDWEQRKLNEISIKVTEKNKDNKFVETFTNSAEFGIISQRDFFDKDISNEKNLNTYYIVRNDDFVYNPRISNFAPVGPINRNKLNKTGVMSPLYYVFRTLDINKTYLENYFKSSKWHKFMKLNGDSGARADRFAIKDSVFNTMPIPYPNLLEQDKIGKFINYVDNNITLHQRKLDQLEQLKEALLQQMFPGKGETVPKLRFAGFEGDWEERKLGEISEMYQPQTITGNDLTDSGYPVFGANGYIGYFSKYNHKSSQVTISARGEGTGTPSYVDGPVWITGNSMVINVDKNGINKMFLYTNLLSFSLKKYVTGGAQPQLVREVLTNVPIKIPSNEEQNKLGYFFGQLNANIINNKQKVSNLQSLKQVLLENMFI